MSDAGSKSRGQGDAGYRRLVRLVGFPFAMALTYGVVAMLCPERALAALRASGRVLLQVAPALAMAFVVMVLMNLLVTPARIQRFLGEGAKVKGGLLSAIAGILSMGSIYAWYPLLKNLREKGVTDFHLANFLGCRAVKLPLLPLMAAYFGWTFTLILSALMVFSALVTGLAVNRLGTQETDA